MEQPIERYLNVQQAYYPSVAANGEQIAFISTITGTPQVWQVARSADGQVLWPDQLTFDADRVLGVWCSPAPGDGRLIYAADRGGNENAQLFLLDPNGGEERALTAGYDDAMHTFGAWSADGLGIMFAANRRDPARFDVYVQLLNGEARLVWQHDEPGFLEHMSFSPDGTRAVASRAGSSFRHDLFEIDLQTGAVRHLTPGAADARYQDINYASDGGSVFVATDRDADFLYAARLDLDTLELAQIAAPSWDVELLHASPDGSALAYVVNEDGVSKLYLHDLQTGATRPAPIPDPAPGVVAWLDHTLSFSPNGRSLAFSWTSATRTSDVWVWDLNTDTVQAITRSAHGGLLPDSFVAPELIRYPSFDGLDIPAWFYKATNGTDQLQPAIVVVHGGPESQARPFFQFFVQYCVHHGYAVLAPNVRGSTGYGSHYGHLDDVEKRMDSVADLAHAAHWLKAQPGIDGDQLIVYGGSYGGFMVLATLTTNPDLWAAGVEVVGISNFVTFLERTSGYRRAHREAEYGSLQRDRDLLERISPLNQVDKIAVPLMVIHGANDPRVPLNEAEQLVQALQARNVPVEFLVFDDEGHGVIKLHNKRVAYPSIIRFLNTFIGTASNEGHTGNDS
jgi:dipeptidyl aminopeptidase/acylaminoacyl peptidase